MIRPPPPSSEAWLRRYARQVVLPEIGEAGQRRLGEATVRLSGHGDALAACAVHLAAAGVGSLEISSPTPFSGVAAALLGDVRALDGPPAPEGTLVAACIVPSEWTESFRAAGTGPVAKAEGALAADVILRRIACGSAPSPRIAIAPDGTVTSATSIGRTR